MKKVILISVFAVLALSACRTRYVLNTATPVSGAQTTQMEKSILAACKELGWYCTKQEEGKIDAILMIRSHTARVDIDYAETGYNVTYKDSTNLGYHKRRGTIHRQYNNWVRNLDEAIRKNLIGTESD
ncbi:hypothetical protein Dip518_000530 [Parelusimicrobium proximum]|uniref:hypothetical protein n=1 Tax=Parelusimicrobium proximum TaxID=3228953 RepID=UPI003D1791EC